MTLRFDPMRKRPLLTLTLVALALRLAAVIVCAKSECPTYEHGAIAANLLAGRGFSIELLGQFGPTAQQGPLYPFALMLVYAVFGVGSHAAHWLMQIAQCFVGAAAVPAVAWLGWSLWPARRSVGWIAAGLLAVHPVHIYLVTHIQVVACVTTLLAALAAAALAGYGSTRRAAGVAGLAAGVLLLLEPILALALPWLAIGWWRQSSPAMPRWRWLGLAALACGATLAPWLARNYFVFGEPLFVKSTFGYALWQGNNPQSWGTDKIPKPTVEILRQSHDGTLAGRHEALLAARSETLYIDDVVLKPSGYREFRGLSEPQRCQLLGRRAAQFIREQPGQYLRLCASRLAYFTTFDATNPKAAEPAYRAVTVAWLALVFIGFAARQTDWRRAWPMAGLLVSVALFHVLTITSARFRIPLEPLTLPWAACALAPAWSLVGWLRRPTAKLVAPLPQKPIEQPWRRAA